MKKFKVISEGTIRYLFAFTIDEAIVTFQSKWKGLLIERIEIEELTEHGKVKLWK